MRWLLLILVLVGCGSHCPDVQRARAALVDRPVVERTADIRITVPFARANALLAELLAADPIRFVEAIELQPGSTGKLRFAITVEALGHGTTVIAEVRPRMENGVVEIGIGPDAIVGIGSERTPAYQLVREQLLGRLGPLTHVTLRLPPVPIASVTTTSTTDALVLELVTALPVRHGLASPQASSDEITVTMSGSTVAELANWGVETGRVPQWYSRGVKPDPEGEFRPRFDYRVEDPTHPFKVYSFQERGGCSYFRVGVAVGLRLDGDALVATALDRRLEESAANPAIEAAAWVKYFLVGAFDKSKRIAAETELVVAGRPLVTQVVSASYTLDEVAFGLRFEP